MVKPSLMAVIRRSARPLGLQRRLPSMKDKRFLIDNKAGRLDARPVPSASSRGIVRLDHDIRTPWSPTRTGDARTLPEPSLTDTPWASRDDTWNADLTLRCFFQHAGLLGATSPGAPRPPGPIDISRDDECRSYKELLGIALGRVGMLEKIVAEQYAQLTDYFGQIADLSNTQNQQAGELQAARDENDRLTEQVAALQNAVNERDTELADVGEKLTASESDRAALQSQLDDALRGAEELSGQLLDLNMALNDRETAAASTQEQLDRLTAAFNDLQAEKNGLSLAIEDMKRRHDEELYDQRARFEHVIGKLRALNAKRERELKELEAARSTLAGRYDSLVDSVGTLEAAHRQMQEKIDSQAKLIERLESELNASREAAERQKDESNAELQRMRTEQAVAENALEAICRDISLLLPDGTTQSNRADKPRYQIAASHMKAA